MSPEARKDGQEPSRPGLGAVSAGKLWGLRRLADEAGHFRMVALDQRPPIMALVRDGLGVDTAPDDQVTAVKQVIARAFAEHASALLVDPIWAYPFVADLCSPRRGLILTLEDHGFEETGGGRRSAAITHWSVPKIRRLGADGVKVLAYHHPHADPAVNAHQAAFVRGVGQACRAHDIPFILELIVYPLAGGGTDYTEAAEKHPELVLESVRSFAAPEFAVDLFKLESPIPAARVPEPGSGEVQAVFDALGDAAGRPWVMLSLGAGKAAFERILAYAFAAGASGFLAGRAVWLEAAKAYPDLEAMRRAMAADAVPYFDRLSALARERARPWFRHPCFGDGPELAHRGLDFPRLYEEPA